jgi:hypothetical protein
MQCKKAGTRMYNATLDEPVKKLLLRGDVLDRIECHESMWFITFLFASAGRQPDSQPLETGIHYLPYYLSSTAQPRGLSYGVQLFEIVQPNRRYCAQLADLCFHFRRHRFEPKAPLEPLKEERIELANPSQPTSGSKSGNSERGYSKAGEESVEESDEQVSGRDNYAHFSPEQIKTMARLGVDHDKHPKETTLCYFATKIHAFTKIQPVNHTSSNRITFCSQ